MDCAGKDLIRPMYPIPDGGMVISRHRPDHAHEYAVAVPTVAGRPMARGEECVSIESRGDGTYTIVDSYVHGQRAAGPAQVATDDYRCGWERTFSARGGTA